MGELFKPMRRKIGVVTLLMASLLMVGWMRSFVVRDTITIHSRFPVLCVASKDGRLSWERHSPLLQQDPFDSETAQVLGDEVQNYWEPWEIRWRWRQERCGFLSGSGVLSLSFDKFPPQERRWLSEPPQKRRVEVWIIPYWPNVVLLTLLSVWLLVYKPRKSIQKKTAKLIRNEEA